MFFKSEIQSEWNTQHTSTCDTGILHVEWGSNHDIDLAVKICWQSITILISPDLNEKLMETSITFIIQNQGNIKIDIYLQLSHQTTSSLSISFFFDSLFLISYRPNISNKYLLETGTQTDQRKIGILSHKLWQLEKIFAFELALGLDRAKI